MASRLREAEARLLAGGGSGGREHWVKDLRGDKKRISSASTTNISLPEFSKNPTLQREGGLGIRGEGG